MITIVNGHDTIKTFREWFDDADMPEKMPDGTWVDLETGLKYEGASDQKIEKTWAERQAIKRSNELQRVMRSIDEAKRNQVKSLSLKDVSDRIKKLVANQNKALKKIGVSKESANLTRMVNDLSEFGEQIKSDIEIAGNASLLTKKSKDIKDKFLQFTELNSEASREQNRVIKAAPQEQQKPQVKANTILQVVHRPDFHVASPVPTGLQPRFTLFTDASFIYSFGCLDATSFIPTGSIENYYFFRDSVVGIFCSQRT